MPTYVMRCPKCKKEVERELANRARTAHYQSWCDSTQKTVDLIYVRTKRASR